MLRFRIVAIACGYEDTDTLLTLALHLRYALSAQGRRRWRQPEPEHIPCRKALSRGRRHWLR